MKFPKINFWSPKFNLWLRENKEILSFIGLLVAACGLYFTAYNTHREAVQLRVSNWNSFRHEFDHDLLTERKECGKTFGKKEFASQYSNIMDFFETVGLLVQTGRIDEDLFDDTWSYHFSGYFRATEIYLEQEKKRDPRAYEHVFYLSRKFKKQMAQSGPKNLQDFFNDEKKLPI